MKIELYKKFLMFQRLKERLESMFDVDLKLTQRAKRALKRTLMETVRKKGLMKKCIYIYNYKFVS